MECSIETGLYAEKMSMGPGASAGVWVRLEFGIQFCRFFSLFLCLL